jgi:hypothetical protein
LRVTNRHVQKLERAVHQEQESRHDAQQRIGVGLAFLHELHGLIALLGH